MNKILMGEEVYVLDENILSLTVKGSNTIYIKNNINNIELNIEIEDNSSLKILDYNSKNKNTKIEVKQKNNSNFEYYHGFDIKDEYNFVYRAYINGNCNKNVIKIHGITSGTVVIDADEIVKEKTIDNDVLEDIKVLNNKGNIEVLPKLSVRSKEVIANHKNAISNIREEDLFYLNTKGIEKEKAILLIKDSYRFGLFKNEEPFLNLVK